MVESWQVKKYYRPRVLIPVSDVLDNPYPGSVLLCLSGAEVNLIRNALDYCHRRSTFVVTYGTDTYVSPDNETWDLIQAVVAELEGKLMADCSDLIDAIDRIDGTLDEHTTEYQAMVDELALLAEALACICSKMPVPSTADGTDQIVAAMISDGTLQTDDPYPLYPGPGEDAEACAIAQLIWSFAWEFLVEIVQPVQKKAVSILLPSAMAVLASWLGTTVIGIPVGIVLVLLWDIIEIWVDGRLEDVANAFYALKEEIVCAAYDPLRNGESLQAASNAMAAVINDQGDLSPIDKLVFRQLTAPWALDRMKTAWDNATAWAVARVSPGYCSSTCGISGDTWYAYEYTGPTSQPMTITHTETPAWLHCCWNYVVPDGETFVGVVFDVEEKIGAHILKRMRGPDVGCGGTASAWGSSSDELQEGQYFSIRTGQIDTADCKAQLCPGATTLESTVQNYHTGPKTLDSAFELGYYGAGSATIRVQYLIYKKA